MTINTVSNQLIQLNILTEKEEVKLEFLLDNWIKEAPQEKGRKKSKDIILGVFKNDTYLNLAWQGFDSLPNIFFGNLLCLTKLHLDQNNLIDLPISIKYLDVLKELDLGSNQLKTLPADLFCNLLQLTKLSLHNNHIETLPDDLFNMVDSPLKTLQLSKNLLKTVPSSTVNLKKLEKLDLAENHLSTLPADLLCNLPQLLELDLRQNQIETLPDDIFNNSSELEELNLSFNKLIKLPSSIGCLKKLKKLSLAGNPISELPAEILKLPKTCEIDFTGCEFSANAKLLLSLHKGFYARI